MSGFKPDTPVNNNPGNVPTKPGGNPVQPNPTPPKASKPAAGLGTPMDKSPTICPR